MENLFAQEWDSASFFYELCTPGELGLVPACPAVIPPGGRPGISDVHFTPGNPRNVRGSVTFYFWPPPS